MTDIKINGPEVERADGTIRCIGYGVDSEDRVTGRFALPKDHEWDAPDGTESLEYVEDMDELPAVDPTYKSETQ